MGTNVRCRCTRFPSRFDGVGPPDTAMRHHAAGALSRQIAPSMNPALNKLKLAITRPGVVLGLLLALFISIECFMPLATAIKIGVDEEYELSKADNIGSRTNALFGGDANGNNLRAIGYTANSLNEYSGIIAAPGFENIMGAALATNTVVVNGNTADRKIEYFHCEVTANNTNGPVWQNVAVTSGGATTNGGSVITCARSSSTSCT